MNDFAAVHRNGPPLASEYLVAMDGDRAIGFVCYGQNETLDCGEVFAIYVLTDYHNQKVSYELMNAAFEKLSAHSKIALWVLKGSQRAIKFYERYRFCFDGTEQKVKLGTQNTELRMIFERK